MKDGEGYPLSKELLLLWTQLAAHQPLFKSRGIRVIAVSPGPVETPILEAVPRRCSATQRVDSDIARGRPRRHARGHRAGGGVPLLGRRALDQWHQHRRRRRARSRDQCTDARDFRETDHGHRISDRRRGARGAERRDLRPQRSLYRQARDPRRGGQRRRRQGGGRRGGGRVQDLEQDRTGRAPRAADEGRRHHGEQGRRVHPADDRGDRRHRALGRLQRDARRQHAARSRAP